MIKMYKDQQTLYKLYIERRNLNKIPNKLKINKKLILTWMIKMYKDQLILFKLYIGRRNLNKIANNLKTYRKLILT